MKCWSSLNFPSLSVLPVWSILSLPVASLLISKVWLTVWLLCDSVFPPSLLPRTNALSWEMKQLCYPTPGYADPFSTTLKPVLSVPFRKDSSVCISLSTKSWFLKLCQNKKKKSVFTVSRFHGVLNDIPFHFPFPFSFSVPSLLPLASSLFSLLFVVVRTAPLALTLAKQCEPCLETEKIHYFRLS